MPRTIPVHSIRRHRAQLACPKTRKKQNAMRALLAPLSLPLPPPANKDLRGGSLTWNFYLGMHKSRTNGATSAPQPIRTYEGPVGVNFLVDESSAPLPIRTYEGPVGGKLAPPARGGLFAALCRRLYAGLRRFGNVAKPRRRARTARRPRRRRNTGGRRVGRGWMVRERVIADRVP